MSRVILFAVDPGGANCIVPVFRALSSGNEFDPVLYGKGLACRIFQSEGLPFRDIEFEPGYGRPGWAEGFLGSALPRALVTGTSIDDFRERDLWRAASGLGVPSAAILDYWVSYTLRFSSITSSDVGSGLKPSIDILPDHICVPDGYAKQEMVKEGFDPDRLAVTGQPHFDALSTLASGSHEAASRYRSGHDIAEGARIITYVSDALAQAFGPDTLSHWGLDDMTVLQALFGSLGRLCSGRTGDWRAHLVIRPHPREPADTYDDLISSNKWDRIDVSRDSETPARDLILASDAVAGISSIMLLEAAVFGKAVFSIQPGIRQPDPFILSRTGRVRAFTSPDGLDGPLEEFLSGKVRGNADLSFAGGATDKVTALIREMIVAGK